MEGSSLPDFLKPFHERASLAEGRLAKLEAVLKANAGKKVEAEQNTQLLSSLVELRGKLEKAREEHVAEREQLKKEAERHAFEKLREEHAAEKEQLQKELERLVVENAKLQYRVIHLVRAVKEDDKKLGSASAD